MLPIPIGTDRPQRRFPWMNVALIAANVVIYAMSHQFHPAAGARAAHNAFLAPGWPEWMLSPQNPRLLQFLSYQFLHENFAHIFFNMLFLYVFGNNLEEKLGHLAYLAFYLTGGVLAGCGQLLTSDAATLGASGSISAVAGLFLVLLPRTHIRMFIWFYVYVDVWEIPSFYFVLFSVAKDLFEPLLFGSTGTAYQAHLSGNVTGFLIGMLLLATRLVQRDHYDLLAVYQRWRRRKVYESVVSQGYNPFGISAGDVVLARSDDRKPANPRVEGLRMEIGELIHAHQLPRAAEKFLELRQIEPTAMLGSDDQLDVANQLMSDRKYPEAAAAYEDYLRQYAGSSQHENVMLILGLIYTQYLPKKDRAAELYRKAIPRLHDQSQRTFAEAELARLEAEGFTAPPPANK